jgi:hypothetical protein
VIETISAVDRDEPQTGHRFLFSLLSPGDGATANFTLRDNQGDPHMQRGRQRETDTQAETDRQRHTHRARERERQAEGGRERHADIYTLFG